MGPNTTHAQGHPPVWTVRAWGWDGKIMTMARFGVSERRAADRYATTAIARPDVERVATTREGGI